MLKTNKSSISFLEQVARHEGELAERVEAARREAQTILQEADARAHQIQTESAKILADELETLRQETEVDCHNERQRVLSESDAKLAELRVHAAAQTPEIVDSVMALILPQTVDKER